MLLLMWPSAWVLFVPVCAIEAWIAKRLLALSLRESIKLAVAANAWSTLLGIPLTWLALLALEMVGGLSLSALNAEWRGAWLLLTPLFTPWLGPGTEYWHVYAAAAFLCLPFMLVSMRVERWSAETRVAPEQARRWSRYANLATYLPIVVALVSLAVVAALTRAGEGPTPRRSRAYQSTEVAP
jgi:hypothetical protein